MTDNRQQTLLNEVMQAEQAWVQAHREGDVATLEQLMAEDYALIRSDGAVVGKEEDLASYRSGDREWFLAEGDEYDVRIYGHTAVVIGRWRARGVNTGEAFDYTARFMSVYVKRDGRWQMVAAQSTPLPDILQK